MKKVNTYFFNYPNFGDSLNSIILERLFNIKVVFSDIASCDLTCIGSNLDDFYSVEKGILSSSPVFVWGAGYNQLPTETALPYQKRIFHAAAVRGKESLRRISKTQQFYPETPVLGDPGILAPLCIKTSSKKKYSYCIIPHYVDFNLRQIKTLHNSLQNSIVVDVTKNCKDILNYISQSDFVISSSLHGLILADTLGVPCAWLSFSDKICGGEYKYDDFYSVFGYKKKCLYYPESKNFDLKEINSYMSDYNFQPSINFLQKQLIRAFPL